MTTWAVGSNFPLLSLPFPHAGKLRHGRLQVSGPHQWCSRNQALRTSAISRKWLFDSAVVLSNVSTCVCQQLRWLLSKGPQILGLCFILEKFSGSWRKQSGWGITAKPWWVWWLGAWMDVSREEKGSVTMNWYNWRGLDWTLSFVLRTPIRTWQDLYYLLYWSISMLWPLVLPPWVLHASCKLWKGAILGWICLRPYLFPLSIAINRTLTPWLTEAVLESLDLSVSAGLWSLF